jgi:hypothetical protein
MMFTLYPERLYPERLHPLIQLSDSIGRPKANDGVTDNIIAGDKTPKMAVVAVVAVIA